MKTIILLLILVFPVTATVLEELSYEDIINPDRSITESVLISLMNNTETQIRFTLPANAENVLLNGVPINATSRVIVPLNCSVCKFRLNYDLVRGIRKEDESFVYARTINAPSQPLKLKARVRLPSGMFIVDDKGLGVVPAGKVSSDGTHIYVDWDTEDPTLPQRFYIRYSDSAYYSSLTARIWHELGKGVVWFFILVSIIAGGVLGYEIGKRRKVPTAIPSFVLSPDEKKAVREIKAYFKEQSVIEGKKKPMNQKELTKRLNWPKSKTSNIVSHLEYKKVLKRERVGRSFHIELRREIKD